MKKIYTTLFCLSILFSSAAFSQAVRQVGAVNFVFVPANFSANVGDTIRFTFGNGSTPGGFPHTTTSTSVPAGAATWDNPLNATNTVFNYVVRVAGTYNYICIPHQGAGMVGQFVVSAALPIKMTAFNSSFSNGQARLTWQTASEQNADHFSVQQSYNGIDFAEIGRVAATGNSNGVVKYAYTVPNVINTASYAYYRLLMVDKDLKEQYSDIILLHLPQSVESHFVKKMYPNPAENGDHLHFNFDAEQAGSLNISIFEPSGRQVFTMPVTAVEGVNNTHMPLPKLKKGSYFVQFGLGEKKQTMPLFVR